MTFTSATDRRGTASAVPKKHHTTWTSARGYARTSNNHRSTPANPPKRQRRALYQPGANGPGELARRGRQPQVRRPKEKKRAEGPPYRFPPRPKTLSSPRAPQNRRNPSKSRHTLSKIAAYQFHSIPYNRNRAKLTRTGTRDEPTAKSILCGQILCMQYFAQYPHG
jgi:hypothetical protein